MLTSALPGSSVTDAGTTTTRQWYRGAVAIVGQTGANYTLTALDYGQAVSVRYTVTKSNYASVVLASSLVNYSLAASGNPTISGVIKVGNQLTAVPPTYSTTGTPSVVPRRLRLRLVPHRSPDPGFEHEQRAVHSAGRRLRQGDHGQGDAGLPRCRRADPHLCGDRSGRQGRHRGQRRRTGRQQDGRRAHCGSRPGQHPGAGHDPRVPVVPRSYRHPGQDRGELHAGRRRLRRAHLGPGDRLQAQLQLGHAVLDERELLGDRRPRPGHHRRRRRRRGARSDAGLL